MAPETFVPARRAALHCEALVARASAPADELAGLARLGRALCDALPAQLAPIFGSSAMEARVAACEWLDGAALAERIGPVAGNLLLPVGDAGGRLFASLALPPLTARLNRLFGGGGQPVADGPLPGRLPGSLRLLLRRLEAALLQVLGAVLDPAVLREGEPARLEPDFSRLALFPAHLDAGVLSLAVNDDEGPAISLLLAGRKALLGRLLQHLPEGGAHARAEPATLRPALADLPLPITARLAELKLPLGRLLALKPGEVLPLALPRSVPLLAAGHTIATATMGEQDDRVALAIERVLIAGEPA